MSITPPAIRRGKGGDCYTALWRRWSTHMLTWSGPRGGHNSKGRGTVEKTRALNVMRLKHAGYLAGLIFSSLHWVANEGSWASVLLTSGRDAVPAGLQGQSAGRGMAARQPADSDPVGTLSPRRRAALVHLWRIGQWRALWAACRAALQCGPVLRVPALLRSWLCRPARRPPWSRASPPLPPAQQARPELHWSGCANTTETEVDALEDIFADYSADRGGQGPWLPRPERRRTAWPDARATMLEVAAGYEKLAEYMATKDPDPPTEQS